MHIHPGLDVIVIILIAGADIVEVCDVGFGVELKRRAVAHENWRYAEMTVLIRGGGLLDEVVCRATAVPAFRVHVFFDNPTHDFEWELGLVLDECSGEPGSQFLPFGCRIIHPRMTVRVISLVPL